MTGAGGPKAKAPLFDNRRSAAAAKAMTGTTRNPTPRTAKAATGPRQ